MEGGLHSLNKPRNRVYASWSLKTCPGSLVNNWATNIPPFILDQIIPQSHVNLDLGDENITLKSLGTDLLTNSNARSRTCLGIEPGQF
jgi:hypothetical protein